MDESTRSKSEAEPWSPVKDRRWKRQDAEQMARAYRASGNTVIGFATEHGLQEQRIRWWLQALQRSRGKADVARGARFVPVRVVRPASSATAAVGPKWLEIIVGKAVVRVVAGFDAGLLRRVVAALSEGAC